MVGEEAEKCSFDRAPDHAATHQERIDFIDPVVMMRQGNTDQAIVAETILDLQRKAIPAGRLDQLRNLLLGVTPRGEIELVGLVRQLRDSRERSFAQSGNFYFLVQGTVEVLAGS